MAMPTNITFKFVAHNVNAEVKLKLVYVLAKQTFKEERDRARDKNRELFSFTKYQIGDRSAVLFSFFALFCTSPK